MFVITNVTTDVPTSTSVAVRGLSILPKDASIFRPGETKLARHWLYPSTKAHRYLRPKVTAKTGKSMTQFGMMPGCIQIGNGFYLCIQ